MFPSESGHGYSRTPAEVHRYILVIMDYAPRYLQSVSLRTASAKAVAEELFLFSQVDIVKEVLTDQ